jgi:hypothetical protein
MRKTVQHHRKCILGVILLALFVVINICKAGIVNAEAEKGLSTSGKLLVLPFHNMAELYGKNNSVRCPICGKVFISGEVPDKATSYLSDKLVYILRRDTYYKKMVVSDSQWGDFDLMSKNNQSASEIELLMKAGRAANADAVMAGYLYRFRQRVGSRISVDTPASVAFGMHLIDVKTGRQLWKGHFDETQRSLSENLFKIEAFIKRKASWVTAEEMAVSGLEEVLETLPKR